MKFCYQVATPDVAVSDSVTAYQGPVEKTFGDLAALGYDGVELMTLDPGALDWHGIKAVADGLGLTVALVCTGEVFGQLGLSFASPDAGVRAEAIARVNGIIDFAGFFGANVNIGRVRGQYTPGIAAEQTEEWAVEAFRAISDHAAPLGVTVALENVTRLQTNFLNTLAETKRLMDRTDRKSFRLMMDVFHMYIEEKDLFQSITQYLPDTVHVHLADNNRRYPGHCGLDFERILRAFRNGGYDGAFTTEIYQLPSMEEAARRSIAHLAPLFNRVYGHACGAAGTRGNA